jgi:hypothetical protein
MLTIQTSAGCVVWVDGAFPRVVLPEAGAEQAPWPPRISMDDSTEAGVQAAAPRRRVVLHGPLSPAAFSALERVAQMAPHAGALDVVVEPTGTHDPPEAVLGALGTLEQQLQAARADLLVNYELDIGLATDAPILSEFVLPRLPYVTIGVRDRGQSESESEELAARAAEVSQQGIRLRPTLCLTRYNAARWPEWAATWRGISCGAGLIVDRPAVSDGDYRGALNSLPAREAVCDFLLTLYRSCAFDLWSTAPFTSLLQTVFLGSPAVAQCGAERLVCIDGSGAIYSCQHGLAGCPGTRGETCNCAWAPFCDAVCAPCPALRGLANTVEWPQWERLFCPAVAALMPKIFDDWAIAARYQRALSSRPPDERLRVAAQGGRLRTWREQVGVGEARQEG